MPPSTGPRRRAGILVPLFSIPSSRSWGIGEIGDIAPFARWLAAAGQRLLQLLPINEMPPGETSPYSALSAMAIDPQFISMADVGDFQAAGGEGALDAATRARLDAVRSASRIDYPEVRALKQHALRFAFAWFREHECGSRSLAEARSANAEALRAFIDSEGWWLDDYALFRALHAHYDERHWVEWPAPVRDRDASALAAVRLELADEILFRQYVQWIAAAQWRAARAASAPVALLGDLPFMVGGDSADVWARQGHFDLQASVGVPPDAFSEDGQDWGMPVYRWDVLARRDYDWLRDRARRNAALDGGYRVDHLVGFYRTYFRPLDGSAPQFTPADEPSQIALGERVLGIVREGGAEIIAEDLGVVPEFVRDSLARLGVPGYRVFRWEREWNQPQQPFRDPAIYPPASVATSGTHDTEPMAVWWESATDDERQAVLAIPSIRQRLASDGDEFSAMLGALYASGSDLVILPVQDIFGWRDRINQPATVGDMNWTWRLPWPSDRLDDQAEARAVAARLKAWAVEGGRT
jgi:4-alpha-glucanotransferase